MSLFTILTTVLTNPSAAVDEHNNNQTNVRQTVKPPSQQRFNEKYGEFIFGKVIKNKAKIMVQFVNFVVSKKNN